MVHATISPGGRLRIPWPADFNALVYVLAGRGTVGAEGRPVRTGQLAVLGAGEAGSAVRPEGTAITVAASPEQESRAPHLDVLVLGGHPIREPVAWAGPFVMNNRAEIVQAFEDYQRGRMGVIPATELPGE
jgi:redox-sensitive bicupin YhaK (pirin superfamily)